MFWLCSFRSCSIFFLCASLSFFLCSSFVSTVLSLVVNKLNWLCRFVTTCWVNLRFSHKRPAKPTGQSHSTPAEVSLQRPLLWQGHFFSQVFPKITRSTVAGKNTWIHLDKHHRACRGSWSQRNHLYLHWGTGQYRGSLRRKKSQRFWSCWPSCPAERTSRSDFVWEWWHNWLRCWKKHPHLANASRDFRYRGTREACRLLNPAVLQPKQVVWLATDKPYMKQPGSFFMFSLYGELVLWNSLKSTGGCV